ncbi:MAG: hypothetical protein GX240_02615 [Candidatus Atribacteria bacterium]|nr:hypothetical protein [Candidatus Atribacteria bacterium]
MKYILAIDDTDQKNWPGTGHLLEKIRKSILENQWGAADDITRHQLFVHPSIPYTSHNSAMCFTGEVIEKKTINNIIDIAIYYLEKESAPESDPGLCVVLLDELTFTERLVDFGFSAKVKKISKQDALNLAEQLSIYLSEHGGTGDGIIGALAGAGLRLSGNDGRFRGSHFFLEQPTMFKVNILYGNYKIDKVCTEKGKVLSGEDYVFLAGKIKTVFKNNKSVLLVKEIQWKEKPIWVNLTHNEVKQY